MKHQIENLKNRINFSHNFSSSDNDERVLCSHIDTSVKCHSHAAICRSKRDEKLCGEKKMLRTPLN